MHLLISEQIEEFGPVDGSGTLSLVLLSVKACFNAKLYETETKIIVSAVPAGIREDRKVLKDESFYSFLRLPGGPKTFLHTY